MKLILVCLMLSSFVFSVDNKEMDFVHVVHEHMWDKFEKLDSLIQDKQKQLDSLKVALKNIQNETNNDNNCFY